MGPNDSQEVLRQLAELRRESRIRHRWIVFIAVCLGMQVFAPEMAAAIAAAISALMVDFSDHYLAPIAAVLLIIVVAGVVVSRSAPSSPDGKPEPSEG